MERATGVVDQNINAAKSAQRLFKHAIDGIFIHHVSLNAQRATAHCLYFGHDGGCGQLFVVFRRGVEINVVDHHIRAQTCQV